MEGARKLQFCPRYKRSPGYSQHLNIQGILTSNSHPYNLIFSTVNTSCRFLPRVTQTPEVGACASPCDSPWPWNQVCEHSMASIASPSSWQTQPMSYSTWSSFPKVWLPKLFSCHAWSAQLVQSLEHKLLGLDTWRRGSSIRKINHKIRLGGYEICWSVASEHPKEEICTQNALSKK